MTRVLPDELRCDALLDERDDRLLRLARQRRHGTSLAVADEAVLADDSHENVGRGRPHDVAEPERCLQPCVERHRLDAGDPHLPSSRSTSGFRRAHCSTWSSIAARAASALRAFTAAVIAASPPGMVRA